MWEEKRQINIISFKPTTLYFFISLILLPFIVTDIVLISRKYGVHQHMLTHAAFIHSLSLSHEGSHLLALTLAHIFSLCSLWEHTPFL